MLFFRHTSGTSKTLHTTGFLVVRFANLRYNTFLTTYKANMYNFNTLTQTQKNAMQVLVNKYAHVAGSYEDTMLAGIVHAYCDSGILTDAYSVEDAALVAQYFTEDAIDEGHLFAFNNFIEEVSGEELLCCKVIAEMCDIIDDAELASAYIGKLTNTLMEHCYAD